MPSIILRTLVWGLAVVAFACGSRAEEAGALPPSHSIKAEPYATGFEFAEGPTFDSLGNLFVVNYRGNGNIGRIAADGTAAVWCDLNKIAPLEGRKPQANGLKMDREGRLIAADAGCGRLLRISPDGKRAEVLADRYEGSRFESLNDVALDLLGNIYFTDPGTSTAEKPSGSVYRYDIATAGVVRLAGNLAYPNGIGVTPDQKQLCVSESARYRLLIFDLTDQGAERQRVLIDFPAVTEEGIRGGNCMPDGLIFDDQGRLYVAMWTGGVINVVDVASGKLLRQYGAGGERATNCHFFGTDLYITVAAKEAVFRLPLGVNGFDYSGRS